MNRTADDALRGKAIVITGATNGIGREAALALAATGPRLYLVCRNPDRAAETSAEITRATGNRDVHVVIADLSAQADVRRAASEIVATGDPIDVLLNNAGAVFGFRRQLSVDGLEMTLALNHLAYFSLSLLLLPSLRAAGSSRIVNVASDAYKDVKGRFDFDDWNAEERYTPIRRYALSKLANILFTRELAVRLAGSGVTVNAGTPPRLTATGFARTVHPLARFALWVWSPLAMSPRKGARGVIHLCSSADVDGLTGTYWSGLRQPELTPAATDAEDAIRLWNLSESLTGVRGPP